jgi:hypothetical protein
VKIVLDEGVPEPLAQNLSGHDVHTVRQLGFRGVKNGRLLELVASLGAEVFITCDKAMKTQQSLSNRPFAVLLPSTNYWPAMREHTAVVAAVLNGVEPGTVINVDCGTFTPRQSSKL